jgi:hypothetical protein
MSTCEIKRERSLVAHPVKENIEFPLYNLLLLNYLYMNLISLHSKEKDYSPSQKKKYDSGEDSSQERRRTKDKSKRQLRKKQKRSLGEASSPERSPSPPVDVKMETATEPAAKENGQEKSKDGNVDGVDGQALVSSDVPSSEATTPTEQQPEVAGGEQYRNCILQK